MYIKKCGYSDATMYMDCLKQYGVPFEWNIDENADYNGHYIKVKSVEPGNIHSICYIFLPKEDISYDYYSSDLYVRITEESKKIIKALHPKSLLSTFVDNIEHNQWYDLPFCKDGRFASGMTLIGYVRK
mgnify:CR=1 FL=1